MSGSTAVAHLDPTSFHITLCRGPPYQAMVSSTLVDSPGVFRPMMRLALPVLAEQSLTMLVGLSDQWLTGWYLQREHLAAVNSMVYVLWLLASLFVVVTVTATALTARYVGAGDPQAANRVLNQSLVVGGVLSLFATLLGLALVEELCAAMQLQGPSAQLAARYLKYVLPVLPLMMLEHVGNACLRGAGDMLTGLSAMIITNVVNIFLSWSLVAGWGPFPKLGWEGVAIGTATGYVAGGTFILCRLVAGRAGLQLRWQLLRLDRAYLRNLLWIGVPGGTDVLSIIFCQMWFVRIINQLGELPAAAHGVAIRIESLAYLPGAAFQVAAATMAGQCLGAGDYQRASRSVLTAGVTCLMLMSGMGLFFYFGAELLAKSFVRPDQVEVIALTAPLLRIVAFGMPPLALLMVFNGALRGSGDTRWPLVFSLVGLLGVRIPATYWLAHALGWGVAGAWYAMLGDLAVRSLLATSRFWHGGWKR